MLLEQVPCDLCASYRVRTPCTRPDDWLRNAYQFPVAGFLTCGVMALGPQSNPESIGAFYPPDYHDNRNTAERIKRYLLQKAFLPELEDKRIPDIDNARGDPLTILFGERDDIESFGVVDYSDHAADPRCRFVAGSPFDNLHEAGSFDLVMAWADFEHHYHPPASITNAAESLMANGEVIILVTNAGSLHSQKACAKDVPRHTDCYSAFPPGKSGQKAGLSLHRIVFPDTIFDSRDTRSVAYGLGKIADFTWEREMLDTIGLGTRAALAIGSHVDRVLLALHLEAAPKRSGTLVARYAKLD